MNPLTNMKNVTKLSERELQNNSKSSWHDQYRDSAWIFIGGLPYDLTEGDIICIFSQYGEIVNINLIRDKDTGKSKGFCFLCYEDQRSTELTVDNLNGIKVLNRILRVDHVSEYKIPKEGKQTGEETKKLYSEGCAPKAVVPVIKNPLMENPQYRRETLADQIQAEIKLPTRLPIRTEIKKELDLEEPVKVKTEKEKTKKKKSRKYSGSDDEDSTDSENQKKGKRKRDLDKDSEKEFRRRKHNARSADGRSRDRSKSDERKKKPRERSTERSERRRSRSQSLNRNRKNRSRSRSLEKKPKSNRPRDYDKKRSDEKYQYSDRNKHEKFWRK